MPDIKYAGALPLIILNMWPSCVNVVLPTSVNVVNATVLVQFQIL